MHAERRKPADMGNVKVPKASGADARTVAEIVTKRTELKNKTVVVRGKVVKYTADVLGMNWVHLRDGSGSAKDKTNDVLRDDQGPDQGRGCRDREGCRAHRQGSRVGLFV